MKAMTPPAQEPRWLQKHPLFSAGVGVPLHMQIERWMTDIIGRGELSPGDRLPREGDLALALGVSRMTLRQALSSLESLGTVLRKTGRAGGTFVSEPRIECDLTGLPGFTEQMRRANVRAGARVVSAERVPASGSIAKALSVSVGSSVYEVIRVRTARREPMALERAYFPTAPFPNLLERRLSGSIYDMLRKEYGQSPHTAHEVLEPVAARAEEARLLQVDVGAPLMLIVRTTFTVAGLAIEYARDLFRPDRVRISLQTGVGTASRAAQLRPASDGQ